MNGFGPLKIAYWGQAPPDGVRRRRTRRRLERWGRLLGILTLRSLPGQNKRRILRTHVPEGRVRPVPEGGLATFTNVLSHHEKISLG